jgi:hypothetical protein
MATKFLDGEIIPETALEIDSSEVERTSRDFDPRETQPHSKPSVALQTHRARSYRYGLRMRRLIKTVKSLCLQRYPNQTTPT